MPRKPTRQRKGARCHLLLPPLARKQLVCGFGRAAAPRFRPISGACAWTVIVRRPKPPKVLRSEVTLPPSVNKTIDSRLDGGKHFESNCTCWQGQTAADCEKETISRTSSSTVCTHSNNVVTGDRVGTPWGRHTARSPAKVVCRSRSCHNLLANQSQFR